MGTTYDRSDKEWKCVAAIVPPYGDLTSPQSWHRTCKNACMSDGLLRLCPACGATNRIPALRLADRGRCGACKQPLSPLDVPLDADPQTFDAILGAAKVPILVDFWAAWCGPCRSAAPEVSAVAQEMAGRAIVLKVDTERYPEIAARYHVQGIPNFVVLRNGKLVRQSAGVTPRAEMKRWLESA